jgi:hypothetical protein
MVIVDIRRAKTHLSRLVDQAVKGSLRDRQGRQATGWSPSTFCMEGQPSGESLLSGRVEALTSIRKRYKIKRLIE